MNSLNDEKRNLLRHYAERDQIIRGFDRTATHQHLLRLGYIDESGQCARLAGRCDGGRSDRFELQKQLARFHSTVPFIAHSRPLTWTALGSAPPKTPKVGLNAKR
jgi:hypothetical protein